MTFSTGSSVIKMKFTEDDVWAMIAESREACKRLRDSACCCCCCILHINRSSLNLYYPVVYVVANPVRGHKEVPKSTGHIMVTTRYSDQQRSKSRQKVMRLYMQWHRPISKRLIKPPYSIHREQPRSTRIIVAYP